MDDKRFMICYKNCDSESKTRTIKEIAQAASLSQRKLAERFSIPYRTMENWCAGVCTPPDYVRMMMQEILGLLK